MGIKFHCPQGHKLNVKAFLAGKKAVCPKCGERVLVPTESEPSTAGSAATSAQNMPQSIDSMASVELVTTSQESVEPGNSPPPITSDPIAEGAIRTLVRPAARGWSVWTSGWRYDEDLGC